MKLGRAWIPIHVEDHFNDRRPARASRRLDVLEDIADRALMMVVGVQYVLLHRRQVFLKARFRVKLCTHGEKVHAVSDEAGIAAHGLPGDR